MGINSGLMGYANIGGTIVRCSDFNVNQKQDPIFFDHVIGLRDSIPTSIYNIKQDNGDKDDNENYNKYKEISQ